MKPSHIKLMLLFSVYLFISINASADTNKGKTLISQFSGAIINIDGKADPVWQSAVPSEINTAMSCDLTAPVKGCAVSAKVSSLWDGALLYLLIEVTDEDIFTGGKTPSDSDGIEVYLDFYNDKNSKFLEDDWMITITANGVITGRGEYKERLKDYAVAPFYDNNNKQAGYIVELAVYSGGIPIKNGTSEGIEFSINEAESSTGKCKNRIFWSDGNNKGLDDNRRWGNVTLMGYDNKLPLLPDTYILNKNIQKAEILPKGIWKSEAGLNAALASAKNGVLSNDQAEIDRCNIKLDSALKNLRRKGKYPDPMDLAETKNLPDPFTFFNGKRVNNVDDWNRRKQEIKDLAQYYEYGSMPGKPDGVTARLTDKGIEISVTDKGKTGTITGLLTLPTVEQCGKKDPYPVIVSIDFWPMKPHEIFMKSGYAVLSITYSSAASDDFEHKGAFYTLYPYNVTTGNDAGTLLAWAWAASRGVDALEYLVKNNPAMKDKLDLSKLVVTGFSRCGKAALAAGLFDDRFKVVSPGASGCGGAAVYRYISSGNVYTWGVSPGNEVLGDKIRHQGHNSNEMLARFLNYPRIYETRTHGYCERLPYDHHEIIAAIAPRAVLITTANDDYANNAEGDAIGYEGARPVYKFLNAEKMLGLNIRTTGEKNPYGFGDGHWQSDKQVQNLVDFSNMVFFGRSLSEEENNVFYSNPYYPTFEKYYGGLDVMMPWIKKVPINN
jgi:endo-1,4-beta-xylanase